MASFGTTGMTLLAIALLSTPLLIGCTSEDGDGDGCQTQTGGGKEGEDPTEIVAKALYCFSDKYIYSNCEEAYRLTQSGDLPISPEQTDQFCTGPCLAETDLVLDCIDEIMSDFQFYNEATTEDVRLTIKAGCGYGPERGRLPKSPTRLKRSKCFNLVGEMTINLHKTGTNMICSGGSDFKVTQHKEADEGNHGSKTAIPLLLWIVIMITVPMLLLPR